MSWRPPDLGLLGHLGNLLYMAVKWVSKPIWRGEVSTGLKFIKIIYMIYLWFSSHYIHKIWTWTTPALWPLLPLTQTPVIAIILHPFRPIQPRGLRTGMVPVAVPASGVYHIRRWGAGWHPGPTREWRLTLLCSEVLVWRQDIAVNDRAYNGKLGWYFISPRKRLLLMGSASSICMALGQNITRLL